MRKLVLAAIIMGLLSISVPALSADEETLKLKAEMLTERIARIEAQSVILNQQYQTAKAEFEAVKKELKELDEKKAAKDKKK